jgi:hypothetical protein
MRKLCFALALAVLLVSAGPAFADTFVTDTFAGVVSGTNNAFTATFTIDQTQLSGSYLETSGSLYGGPNLISGTITVNGSTQTINDSSNAFFLSGEAYLEALNATSSLYVDLLANLPIADLGTALPTMYLSGGDFSNLGAAFTTSSGTLDLTVESVNAPIAKTPEPGTILLLVAGMGALLLLARRQAA